MAKKKSKSYKTITLNRFKISFILLTLGALFFFTRFTADKSPLYAIFSYPGNLLFGNQGTVVLFAGFIIIGLIVLFKEEVLKKSIFKKFFLFLVIFCSVLNFPYLSNPVNFNPENHGGWIGYFLLWVGDNMLGHQITAVKIFFVAILFIYIILIGISLSVKIPVPNVKFKLEENDKPSEKPKIKNNIETTINVKPAEPVEATKTLDEKSVLKSLIKDKILKKIEEKQVEKPKIIFSSEKPTYDINLFEPNSGKSYQEVDEKYLLEKAQALKNKLKEFFIDVEIDGYNIGPSVIQIKIIPEAGVKLSKIESLKNDLALALKTKSLRVLAPIPGTDTVGIEIPNPSSSIVRIKDIIGSKEFNISMGTNFTNIGLGISIDGKIIVKSLEKMPHMLVAGATGTGKSVGVNSFILSLLYQNTPAEMRFIMIDPKQVEFSLYEGMPHLLAPIITEADKAVKVLKWATVHMDERYTKLKDAKVKNIDEYNAKVPNDEKMYRIIIIIDELADLMMTGNKKDTENYIGRIAQKARAVGMHLIVATQRPSVSVVTGNIKANIPTRVAFAMVSQVDSRTVLDQIGAEDLLGRGDMLFMDSSSKFPIRIQCPFVSTEETIKIIESLKHKYMRGISESDIYNQEIINILTQKEGYAGGGLDDGDDEELINQAIQIIQQTRKASATMLQRKLGIGFPKAARIMDILEQRGIVGPQEGAKPRDILI